MKNKEKYYKCKWSKIERQFYSRLKLGKNGICLKGVFGNVFQTVRTYLSKLSTVQSGRHHNCRARKN